MFSKYTFGKRSYRPNGTASGANSGAKSLLRKLNARKSQILAEDPGLLDVLKNPSEISPNKAKVRRRASVKQRIIRTRGASH